MPSIDVDGVSLYYEEAGRGQPVLFCHGIPTDYRAWQPQQDPFSKNYRTITYSRRYASPSNRQGDLADSTIGNNASDLKGLIENLGLGPVHLVGHSYGGFISAYLAADHPDMVRSLTLVEPAVSTLLVEDPESKAQMFSLLLRSPTVALSARRFQSNSLYLSYKALDAGQMERATELNVDGVQDKQGGYASVPDQVRKMMLDNARTIAELKTKFPSFKPHIRRIAMKTLVVNGESSPLWLRKIGQLFARLVPQGESFTVPGTRHFPHLENPVEFNQHVMHFINQNAN
jgi:non-heme chloroperoxidase